MDNYNSLVILASRDSDLISKTLGADRQYSAFYKDVAEKRFPANR